MPLDPFSMYPDKLIEAARVNKSNGGHIDNDLRMVERRRKEFLQTLGQREVPLLIRETNNQRLTYDELLCFDEASIRILSTSNPVEMLGAKEPEARDAINRLN